MYYLHLMGTQKGDIKTPLHDREETIDRWVPEEKPDGATLVVTIAYDDEVELFHKIYEVSVRVGPITAHLGIDVKFKGKIEVWEKKDA